MYVGCGYIEGLTAAYFISYGDTLFRFSQPHCIFHQPKHKPLPTNFHQSDRYPSLSF